MKKKLTSFLVCLLILIAFGGFVFFIGWTQFKIEPNNVGILISKTSGINNKPIYPGTFSWHWEFLIPTNAQLKMFTQEPYIISKEVKGTLPNGEIYQTSYNKNLDFSYDLNFSITIKVTPENTLKLLKENIITDQASLSNYINNAVAIATQKITSYCLETSENNISFRPEAISPQELIKISNISEQYPELTFDSILIMNSKLPDYNLYIKARNLYIKNFDSYTESIEKPQIGE